MTHFDFLFLFPSRIASSVPSPLLQFSSVGRSTCPLVISHSNVLRFPEASQPLPFGSLFRRRRSNYEGDRKGEETKTDGGVETTESRGAVAVALIPCLPRRLALMPNPPRPSAIVHYSSPFLRALALGQHRNWRGTLDADYDLVELDHRLRKRTA